MRGRFGRCDVRALSGPREVDGRECGSGDVEIAVPNSTGFKASLTVGSGDFESDFLPLGYDGETILNHEFDNGDKSATYRFKVGSGDMSFDPE